MQTTEPKQEYFPLTFPDLKVPGTQDVFILLQYGITSSKEITWNYEDNTFEVFNAIDGTVETLTQKELLASNIGRALRAGALYKRN